MKVEIKLNELRIRAHHGVLEQERLTGNDFVINLTFVVDYDGRDRLESTVDYAEVAETMRREMSVPSLLIEHAAMRIAKALMAEFPEIIGGQLTLAKLRPPMAVDVTSASATIALSRD